MPAGISATAAISAGGTPPTSSTGTEEYNDPTYTIKTVTVS